VAQICPVCLFVNDLLNPLNAKLNPIWHLLALLGAHHILHVSRIRVNVGDCSASVMARLQAEKPGD
jgi:hypothetical protein